MTTTFASGSENLEPNAPFACWAVLELLGHRRLAGWITEQKVSGADYLRIDIPKKPSVPASVPSEGAGTNAEPDKSESKKEAENAVLSTQFYGSGAVYGITPVTEEMARNIAYRSQEQTITALGLPAASVAGSTRYEPDFEDDDEF